MEYPDFCEEVYHLYLKDGRIDIWCNMSQFNIKGGHFPKSLNDQLIMLKAKGHLRDMNLLCTAIDAIIAEYKEFSLIKGTTE
jgi:hypothetical protein